MVACAVAASITYLVARVGSIEQREREADSDMSRRVAGLESRNSTMSARRWALLLALVSSAVGYVVYRIHF